MIINFYDFPIYLVYYLSSHPDFLMENRNKYFFKNSKLNLKLNEIVGKEVQYSLYGNKRFGPLQSGQSISVTDQGGVWVGFGFIRKVRLSDYYTFNFDFFPGVYLKNSEEDLGGWLMFRSGLELECAIDSDWKLSLGYDHRSSGDIWDYNPGMETIKISFIKTLI